MVSLWLYGEIKRSVKNHSIHWLGLKRSRDRYNDCYKLLSVGAGTQYGSDEG